METGIANVRIEDLAQLKRDVELIKNILQSEGELTDWAKKELAEARETPEEEFISMEDIEKMIIEKCALKSRGNRNH